MKSKRGRSVTAKVTKLKSGKTDWAKLRGMRDADIAITTASPRTSAADWAHAIAHRGLPVPARKSQIALRVDDDVLLWYRSQGAGYQTRMNAVLKAFRDAHK